MPGEITHHKLRAYPACCFLKRQGDFILVKGLLRGLNKHRGMYSWVSIPVFGP
jgi:hypothetical protein